MALSMKDKFPEIACVYLVYDAEFTIHYVGGTTNLRNRWTNHQKYDACSKLKNPRLAYLNVSPHLVWEAEAFLIRTLQPQFNIKIPSESDLINSSTI